MRWVQDAARVAQPDKVIAATMIKTKFKFYQQTSPIEDDKFHWSFSESVAMIAVTNWLIQRLRVSETRRVSPEHCLHLRLD